MILDKVGVVIAPREYYNWYVELSGNTEDTGGVYLYIFKYKGSKNNFCFWDTNIDELEVQLINKNLVICWNDGVLKAFLSKNNLTKKIAIKIINNFYEENQYEMIFNTTQLNFIFDTSMVIISYYITDLSFENVELSFKQLEEVLLYYICNTHK